MSILGLLGFYKVNSCCKDKDGKEYNKQTYYEWGIRFKIPFTTKAVEQ